MKIFAHRGASGNYPENSQTAILKALEMGAFGIEIDLQSCSDDFVVIHDKRLDRTTNGQGLVSDYTLSELSQLDAGDGFGLPSLAQLLGWLHNTNTTLNIELKHINNPEQIAQRLAHAHNSKLISQDKLIVSSFDHHLLQHLKKQLPWLKIGALSSSIPLNFGAFASALNASSIHLDHEFINQDFVTDCHARGLAVFCYTVDHQDDYHRLHAMGVDGIFTNFPLKMQFLSTPS